MKSIHFIFFIMAAFLYLLAPLHAGNCVGVILAGYEKDCKIQRGKDKSNCFYGAQLYPGDRIIKDKINEVIVQWAPFTAGNKVSSSVMEVVYNPPNYSKSILQHVKEYLKFTKSKHASSYAVTRGKAIILPNDGATLIANYPIVFSWVDVGNYIVFRDNNKKEIYRVAVKDRQNITLTPENIGMKEDAVYEWFIDGSQNKVTYSYSCRLLTSKLSKQLIIDLKLIDDENISENDKKLKKSAYLQLISNAYPEQFDLYWLSYQLIAEIDGDLAGDNRDILDELKKNYKLHLAGDI